MADIKTKREKPVVEHDGFLFRFAKRAADGGKFWRCLNDGCTGRIKTTDDDVFIEYRNHGHNHMKRPDEIKVRQIVTTMKEQAEAHSTSLVEIYRRETVQLASQPEVAAAMPSYQEMRNSLTRHRRKQFPSLPTTRGSIVVPDNFKITTSGRQFLLYASPGNDTLIFCTQDNLRLLCQAAVMCIDGTFESCPSLFSQLFTIHAFDHDKLLPLVYSLMSDKRRESYESIFAILKREAAQLGLQLNPASILSDFESGFLPAIRASFPNSRHRGCHFHFTQAIYRQVQSLGLVSAYSTQAEVRLQIRQLMALAFLPVSIVRLTFNTLERLIDPILAPLFVYFRQQWLTDVPTVTWNVYGEDMRTNNHCEGWHNRFNGVLRQHHPNIWLILRCIQEEQATVEVTRQQLAAGKNCNFTNKKANFATCMYQSVSTTMILSLCLVAGIGNHNRHTHAIIMPSL
jgi:hypothetical protein